jgi:folylpolyglutamate synthase/dihydropteroate synthase
MRDFAHMREWVLLANPQAQVVGIEEPVDALAFAMHHSQADELVVVTGSLFVVAAAREALGLATEVD